MPSHHISRLRQRHHPRRRVGDIQLVSEHVRRQLGSSSYRTLSAPRTRTTLGDSSFYCDLLRPLAAQTKKHTYIKSQQEMDAKSKYSHTYAMHAVACGTVCRLLYDR